MKFIHLTDIHGSKERLPQTLSILKTLTERCKKGDIAFVLFTGDFWESIITATKGSGFSDIFSAMRTLEKYVKRIFMIYGTASHEPSGSLDAFRSEVIQVASTMQFCGCSEYGIIAIPEPRRSEYSGKSAKEIDMAINENIRHFLANQSDRKETTHKNIPLIVAYHGEVYGAVYQNGITACSPTAIPIEALKALNADYYAFGHIHKPQEVFKNAWYAGSACPKDFGEAHDGCYNLVTIENGKTVVEQVSFGLPTYETICLDSPNFPFINPEVTPYNNKYLRVCFNCTKEERKVLNIRQLTDEIKARTNALSVKLEPCVTEMKTTAISEVSKQRTLCDKLVEYAKERKLPLPKNALELLRQIQEQPLTCNAFPQHSFELLSISLRGAIGIRDGQHKEGFDVNFENFEDGIVCIEGVCGSGKSTLLENCHPYPQMLSREGTLKDHFYLKDSHRILVYRDENNLYYRIRMLIDGKTKTGKVLYFVETSKDRNTWESLSEVDGSYDAYKTWVNSTFGSVDVFLRTAFFAKEKTKDAKDISETTKAERMELLSKLAGTEHLKEISNVAREFRKLNEKECEKLKIAISFGDNWKQSILKNEELISSSAKKEAELKEKALELENSLSVLRKKDLEFQKMKAVAEANAKLEEQYNESLSKLEPLYNKLKDAVSLELLKKNFDLVREAKETIRKAEENLSVLQKEDAEKNKALRELTDEILSEMEKEKEFAEILSKIQSKISVYGNQLPVVTDVCPTCGKPLSPEKKAELLAESERVEKLLSDAELERVNAEFETKQVKEKSLELDRKRDSLAVELEAISDKITDEKSAKNKAEELLSSIDDIYIEYTLEEAKQEFRRVEKEFLETKSALENLSKENSFEDVSEELVESEKQLKQLETEINDVRASAVVAERENVSYTEKLAQLAVKEKELKQLEETAAGYGFIEEAFSNNGIPAIELRESAPEIATIANRILEESYGNRFSIRFGDSSELKETRKVNEDFNIIVYDSENGDEKALDIVSSGERIWIKQALFYAFSIVQMNRTGFNFKVRLIDESDGSLDGALRPKYLDMVTAAHRLANARLTLLISHSQEIKGIAQQTIQF